MTMTHEQRTDRYQRRLRKKARAALGKRSCVLCGKRHKNLEAAHIAPTKLNGFGRGMNARNRDIVKNPGHYRWMGKKCHYLFDKLMKLRDALREPGEEPKEEEIPF